MSGVSNEYAEALFSLAAEEGKEEQIMKELDTVRSALNSEPQIKELLCSPAIPLNERIDVVDAVFADAASEYVLSFIKLLCEKRRADIFTECVEKYRALLSAKQSTVTATVTSAVELSEAEKAALKQKLEKMSKSTVVLECKTDKQIMGGLIVEMNGTITDGSLKHRLQQVKDVISG